MKKKAFFATTEELIADLSCWEDPGSWLLVSITEEGGVSVCGFDSSTCGLGQTVKEALLDFARNDEWEDLSYWDEMDLDWSDIIDRRT